MHRLHSMVKEYLSVNGFEETADSLLTEPGGVLLAENGVSSDPPVKVAELLAYFTNVTKAVLES